MKNQGCEMLKRLLQRTTLIAVVAFFSALSITTAQAAVTTLDGWTNRISNTNSSPQSFTYAISPGPNRLLVVAVTTKYGSTATRTYSASYGGKTLTMIAQYNTGRDNTWVGYLKESDLAARIGDTIQVTYSGTPSNTKVFVASYQNVDQSSPITDANGNGSNTTTNNSVSFGRNITVAGGDQLFYVAHSGSSTATHTPPTGYTELLEHTGNGFSVSVGHRNSTSAGSENQTVRFSSRNRVSIVVASLNEAAISSCVSYAPTLAITPASQTITTNGGSASYSVNVKNNDTGSACANASFNLSLTDSDSTGLNFVVPSILSLGSVSLAPGANTSVTLTVQARSGATTGTNSTSVTATAAGHTNGTSNTITTTLAISPLTVAMASLPDGIQNVPYSATLAANGGTLPYTWSISIGSLPAGLSLNSSTGVISGTPTNAGTVSFTVQVTDAVAVTAAKALSITASAQTANQPGLVVAYGFNEGSGSTTADASGNSNTGTVSGAAWTTSGRYGSALSFNGSSNRVDINDANSLDLTTGMTLEAWVYPTTLSGWRTVILKEASGGLAYALYAYDNAPRPAAYINTGGSDLSAAGTSGISLNTWTHLAATYDGSTLRLFVNGTQTGSRTASGSIRVSTNYLRIGGNTLWGEYFSGLIDEVRIYNRALSQAEIQTDMNTPIVVSPPDATPPTAPANLTATAASSTQINLSWTASTDNVGVTGYQIERCQGAGCSTFTQIAATTTTTYGNTGLQASTSYSYRVRATDAVNNLSPYSDAASATTQQSSDPTPPTAPANLTATAASSTQINLSWTASTDNVGVTGYQVERCQGAGCNSFTQIATTTTTTYNNSGLQASTSYSYRVRATDAANNLGPYSNIAGAVTQNAGVEPAGWYAGDMHVHRSCGGSPEALSSMYQRMVPNNLAFISLLADMGNGEVQDPVTDLPRVNGSDDPVSTTDQIVHWDAEWHWDPTYPQFPHHALGGHVVALGLTQASQVWEEYTYPIFNWAHQRGGIAGFAHMQYLDGTNTIPNGLTCCTPIEYPVEVALGSSDFISEDVDDCNSTCGGAASPGVSAPLCPECAIQAYYKLLNCGFRPGFAGGTDYPCNCSNPLGSILTYAQVAGGQMTYSNWVQGIAKGRTVVSRNGHNEFLGLTVNNSATPGDEIKLTSAGVVTVTITWTANQNLSGTIELVQNGVVVASQQASVGQGAPASLSTTVNFANSGWLAARRMDSSKGHMVHTAAVFVTVNNAPVRASAADAQFFVGWMDNLLTKTSPGGAWNSYFPTNLAAAQARYSAAKALYQQIALEASGQPSAPSITTTSLPGGALTVPYTATLAASGGLTPYTWTISSGSLPTGLSLDSGKGTISGTPAAAGIFNFTMQVADSGSPGQTATRDLSITISADANFTIWPATAVPGLVDGGPDSSVELGVKFRADSNGYVKGVRFYKASTNTGTHSGNLWTSTGTLLATATFSSETVSGWQEVLFSSPVAITANTAYLVSYHADNGHYSADVNYFATSGVDNPPLHAIADGVSGGNGVYAYGPASLFPNQTWNSANYWVDVVFSATPPATLSSIAVTPAGQTIQIGSTQQFTATGIYSDGSTQNITSQATWVSSNAGVATISSAGLATAIDPGNTTISAALDSVSGGTSLTVQPMPLTITTTSLPSGALNVPYMATLAASGGLTPYTWSVSSGSLPSGLSLNSSTGAISGTPAAAGTFNFTMQVADSGSPGQTATRDLSITISAAVVAQTPILIISSGSNPFSSYYAEILRTEGFNEFDVKDVSTISSTVLASYDVVVLGEIPLTTAQVTMFGDWVNAGGRLIAMRPDKKLAGPLGLTDRSLTSSDKYLAVNTSFGPGVGIVNQTIQYHGVADLYSLSGASSLATLYSNATTATSSPAVTLNNVGTNGGQAAAFTYDLARSVVYTRQGNPGWAGQDRDGDSLIRSDDLFYPDWLDMDKVEIPQADEQQRLLANLIIEMNSDRTPLPRFWYLPRGLAAAVVMTGDDHGSLYGGGATAGRFDQFVAASPAGCVVDNWECVRGTAYLIAPSIADNPLTNQQAAAYVNRGFEIGVHVDTSPDCSDWTPAELNIDYTSNLDSFVSEYPSLPASITHRMHCVSWYDYDSQPKTELAHGIRLDTTYYYYPPSWIDDRPGLFTGSGMPMRFADANGNLIDVYQAATQMTDESGQSYPYTVDTLLDRAIGPEGYYGVFTANMHNDTAESVGADAIVNSALTRGIPVVSARQMLQWLDGRNGSTFSSLSWSGNTLGFTISVGSGANGLVAMVPMTNGLAISNILYNGSDVPFTVSTVKGIQYALFWAENGSYQVTYAIDTEPPTVSGVLPADGASGISTTKNVTATFSEAMDATSIGTGTIELRDSANVSVPAAVTYNANTRTATLTPISPLAYSTTYIAIVKGGTNGVKDTTGNPMTDDFTWSFTTAALSVGPYTIWTPTVTPSVVDAGPDSAVELGVKFRSDISGYVTGIRFYKAATNTGTHVANLWTNSGTRLATATFTSETASGWQQVNFSSPVAITANTVYVASYHANVGHYSDTQYFFSGTGVDSPPLHALADGVSGFNGVYAYGSTSSFPNQGWHSSNYWVDVVFQP
jgi:hypothetical protein